MDGRSKEALWRLRDRLRTHAASDPLDLARHLKEGDYGLRPAEIASLLPTLLRGRDYGEYFVPTELVEIVAEIVSGTRANVVCDPHAGFGALIATLREVTGADEAIAIERNEGVAIVGKTITNSDSLVARAPDVSWRVGTPLLLLEGIEQPIDLAASVLPFGRRHAEPVSVLMPSGQRIQLIGDLGHLILVLTTLKLSSGGIGIFVVPNSFFWSQQSIYHRLPEFGIGVEAVLAMPAGIFAPFTNVSTSLVIVNRLSLPDAPRTTYTDLGADGVSELVSPHMFVASLSADSRSNAEVVANLKAQNDTGSLESGRLTPSYSFAGVDLLRRADLISEAVRAFDFPATNLSNLSTGINLGGARKPFDEYSSAIYVPLIGLTDVLESPEHLTLKSQNYAQVVIDASKTDTRFVARFLNSELGRNVREMSKSAGLIPKLNKASVHNLPILVPDLQTQAAMVELEADIATNENTLLGLMNEVHALRRELWHNPRQTPTVRENLARISTQLAASRQQTIDSLDQWFETLPFPLASILRAWRATPTGDLMKKNDHLLHFFEATTEFVSIIFLSAYAARPGLFSEYMAKIRGALAKSNLSFEQPTFGTWRLVVEYLAARTRSLLDGKDEDGRALCGELFADVGLSLPAMLSDLRVINTLSAANSLRNDERHGGDSGEAELKLENEKLLGHVEQLREAMKDGWSGTHLMSALLCKPRSGVFENEVRLLSGSNSNFLTETRRMSTCLDIERLYVVTSESARGIELLPLIRFGASPTSQKDACYFFNRVEKDGHRFVSYHFSERSKLIANFEDTSQALKLLSS